MPIESANNKIPEEALNAFLDGILAELRSPTAPEALTQVRSIFRKRIPLHLRSYAAALLILRAAGIARAQPQKPSVPALKAAKETAPAPAARAAKEPVQARAPKRQPAAPGAEKAPAQASGSRQGQAPAEGSAQGQQRRSSVGMVPLFVSMGKRQRLRPQELRVMIGEKAGIDSEELGRVHLFDNYSFIDVPEALAEKIVAAADGADFRGRPIEIKPAKKRGEQSQEKDQEPSPEQEQEE
ncbi:DbpA RNA binding domain-containing protein [bacterium]|nr:DbpA RNA binding domain-containing protein [bacterium]